MNRTFFFNPLCTNGLSFRFYTINKGLSNVYIEGSQVVISKYNTLFFKPSTQIFLYISRAFNYHFNYHSFSVNVKIIFKTNEKVQQQKI